MTLGFVVVMLVESTVGGVVGDLLMLVGLGYLGVHLMKPQHSS